MSRGQKVLRFVGLLTLLGCVAGVFLLTAFNSDKQKDISCSKVEITVDHNKGLLFIDEADIKSLLVQTFGDSVQGDRIRDINLARVEEVVRTNPYVSDAETYLDAGGKMHISIVQKQPLARVINKYGVNFYIDENANKMPVSSKFTCRVPVVTGNIEENQANPDHLETPLLRDVYKLVLFIHASSLWNAEIEQIYVDGDNEFELVPKLGDHRIILGTLDHMEEKFQKLEVFYKEGLDYIGWNKYKTINLSFEGQVVCTKKDNYEEHE